MTRLSDHIVLLRWTFFWSFYCPFKPFSGLPIASLSNFLVSLLIWTSLDYLNMSVLRYQCSLIKEDIAVTWEINNTILQQRPNLIFIMLSSVWHKTIAMSHPERVKFITLAVICSSNSFIKARNLILIDNTNTFSMIHWYFWRGKYILMIMSVIFWHYF